MNSTDRTKYTLPEVARVWGMKPATIIALIRSGELRAIDVARRGMNEQVSAFLTAIDGLADVHDRLQRVVILNDDACTVIRQQDGERTLFYCDPPYVHTTRTATSAYALEMTDDLANRCNCVRIVKQDARYQ